MKRFTSIVTLSLALVCAFNLAACKKSVPMTAVSQAADTPDRKSPTGKASMPAPAVGFLKPYPNPKADVLAAADVVSRLDDKLGWRPELPGQRTVQLWDGETVLFGTDDFGLAPIASVSPEGELFEWEIQTPGEVTSSTLTTRSTNIAYRHPFNADDDSSSVPYMIYQAEDGAPLVVPLGDHQVASNGAFRRFGNKIYSDQGKLVYRLDVVGDDVWRVEGDFYNGFVCSGSLLWRTGDGYVTASHEFGRTTIATWRDEGLSLSLEGTVSGAEMPTDLAPLLRPCPFNGDVKAIVDALSYDPSFDDQPRGGAKEIVQLTMGELYEIGQTVRYDETTWVVLEALDSPPTYLLANYGRTEAEDRGRTMQRVSLLTWDIDRNGIPRASFKPQGSLKDYLLWAAARINALGDERIVQEHVSAETQEASRRILRTAEAKANQVGAGFDEWYKPVINGFAVFAMDLTTRKGLGDKILGVKVSGESLATTAVSAAARSQRLLAAFYITALQGVAISSQIVAAKLTDKDFQQHLATTNNIVGVTAVVNGLRSFYPSPSRAGLTLIGVSGVAMRWRKIKSDEELGYENKNNLGNLAAGGGTAVATVLAQKKGPGAVAAVGKAGVLLSEVIAGRGSPGVIAGTGVEIATDLLVKHPVIRPFASVLAGQVSALIQLGEAYGAAVGAGNSIDRIRSMRKEQVHKANAIIYLAKERPETLADFSAPELGLLLSSAGDPFASYRRAKN